MIPYLFRKLIIPVRRTGSGRNRIPTSVAGCTGKPISAPSLHCFHQVGICHHRADPLRDRGRVPGIHVHHRIVIPLTEQGESEQTMGTPIDIASRRGSMNSSSKTRNPSWSRSPYRRTRTVIVEIHRSWPVGDQSVECPYSPANRCTEGGRKFPATL
jgi:hypothetical protein